MPVGPVEERAGAAGRPEHERVAAAIAAVTPRRPSGSPAPTSPPPSNGSPRAEPGKNAGRQSERAAELLVASDIGGTFTDTVTISGDGESAATRHPRCPKTRPPACWRPSELAAEREGEPVEELLGQVSLFAHGTTVATNAMLEGKRATVGLIQTRGFGDTLPIMRGFKSLGLDEEAVKSFRSLVKQELVVPKRLIARGRRADRLPRPGGDAARRGGRDRDDRRAARRGRRGLRRLAAVVVQERRARAAHRRADRGALSRRPLHAVQRAAAAPRRVPAHGRDRPERQPAADRRPAPCAASRASCATAASPSSRC